MRGFVIFEASEKILNLAPPKERCNSQGTVGIT